MQDNVIWKRQTQGYFDSFLQCNINLITHCIISNSFFLFLKIYCSTKSNPSNINTLFHQEFLKIRPQENSSPDINIYRWLTSLLSFFCVPFAKFYVSSKFASTWELSTEISIISKRYTKVITYCFYIYIKAISYYFIFSY